jgi:transposase
MRPIERMKDADQLKQVALLLEAENTKLHARLKKALTDNARLRGEEERDVIQFELEKLQVELAETQKRLLGNLTERRSESSDEKTKVVTKQLGHGPRQQPKLPMAEPVVHELSSGERGCQKCNGELDEFKDQFEDSEEVSVVERRFVLVKHRRKKYRCRCNASVVTAPRTPRIIPGGRYSNEFAVSVAVDKYLLCAAAHKRYYAQLLLMRSIDEHPYTHGFEA